MASMLSSGGGQCLISAIHNSNIIYFVSSDELEMSAVQSEQLFKVESKFDCYGVAQNIQT